MPIGQGWLNALVKVNNKHVVYKVGEKDGEEVLGRFHSSSHVSNQAKYPPKSSATIGSGKSPGSENVENQTIQRVNNRKNRRRLHRTTSATDLIRDQATSQKGQHNFLRNESSSTHATLERAGASGAHNTPSLAGLKSNIVDRITSMVEPDSPLRLVAGLLGTDFDSLSFEPSRIARDESLNSDSASLQWAPPTRQLDTESLPSKGGYSLPTRAPTPHQQDHPFQRSASADILSKGGFRFPSNIFSNDNHGKCRHCIKFETELLAAKDDMEYLRAVALQNEFVCSSCNGEASEHPKQAVSAPNSLDLGLRHSDRLLDEVTARHKTQLEQLMKDRQRWQHDAHVKLQKYAGLCQDLNEEATIRNEEIISLRKEVESLRLQRDEMAGELETARATIDQYERDAQERKVLESMLQYHESTGLDEAVAAIKMRDSIVEDLSARLRKTMNVLQIEREQQRQRRQIIFPTHRTSISADHQNLEIALLDTRATLEEVRSELLLLQRTSQRRESEWETRVNDLERQLKHNA